MLIPVVSVMYKPFEIVENSFVENKSKIRFLNQGSNLTKG